MMHAKCKCGLLESWSSYGFPACIVCEKCGTTLGGSSGNYREPIPHEFRKYYEQNTGKPYLMCIRCGYREKFEEVQADEKSTD